jgi:hypothetical protein
MSPSGALGYRFFEGDIIQFITQLSYLIALNASKKSSRLVREIILPKSGFRTCFCNSF